MKTIIALLAASSCLINQTEAYSRVEKRFVLQKIRNTPLGEEFKDRKSSNQNHPRVMATYCVDTGPLTVTRLMKSPPNVESIITAKTAWTDSDYTGNANVLFASDTVRNSALSTTFNTDLLSGAIFSARWPTSGATGALTATIFHPTGDVCTTSDIVAPTAYDEQFIAVLSSISEYPNYMKNVFLIQKKNDAGIYGVQFYIRGKPWHIALDDTLFYNNPLPGTPTLVYAQMNGLNTVIWGPLLEKAWTKVVGSYATYIGDSTGM